MTSTLHMYCLLSFYSFVFLLGFSFLSWALIARGGVAFLFQKGRVGDMWLGNILLNSSWLTMHLVGIPPGFSEILLFDLKATFTFLCVLKNIRNLRSLSGFRHHVESFIVLTWKSKLSNLKCLLTSKWYVCPIFSDISLDIYFSFFPLWLGYKYLTLYLFPTDFVSIVFLLIWSFQPSFDLCPRS